MRGFCTECSGPGDCPGTKQCNNNYVCADCNSTISCRNSTNCNAFCDDSTGKCFNDKGNIRIIQPLKNLLDVFYLDSLNCSRIGKFCSPDKAICVNCVYNDDCANNTNGSFCSPTNGCVKCLKNSDCVTNEACGATCNQGKCNYYQSEYPNFRLYPLSSKLHCFEKCLL